MSTVRDAEAAAHVAAMQEVNIVQISSRVVGGWSHPMTAHWRCSTRHSRFQESSGGG